MDTGTYFYTQHQLATLVHKEQLDAIRDVLAQFADGIEETTIPVVLASDVSSDYKAGALCALNTVLARFRETIQEIDSN